MNTVTLFTLIPIFAFSVLSVAIITERFLFFKKNKVNIMKLKTFFPGNLLGLKQEAQIHKDKNLFFDFIADLFSQPSMTHDELQDYLDSKFTYISLLYTKRLHYLGTFAKLSTLVGLFGTVIGMIIAFNNIVQEGISTASIVAGGISTALITTAVGLTIAIPTTFFYEYFNNRYHDEIKKMEIIVSDILIVLQRIKKRSQA